MRALALALVLSGCGFVTEGDRSWRWDLDGDGVERPADCDDSDPELRLAVDWYLDGDGDLYGAGEAVTACVAPPGHVAEGGDCDDDRRLAHPGAAELCNDLDDDCDGVTDEDVDIGTWYPDGDGDGYGDDGAPPVSACVAPAGHVAIQGDCDDARADVNPDAAEPFDGIDNDCDGLLDCDDDDLVVESATFWPDGDADGYGDLATAPMLTCDPPAGWVLDGTDCDDGDPLTNPDREWYADVDGDGYGDPQGDVPSCVRPPGYVANFEDCDDTDAARNWLALEICDGVDNNCNGDTDDDDAFLVGAVRYHADVDGDGFGDPVVFVNACAPPVPVAPDFVAWVVDGSDCRDDDPNRHPEAPEICNGLDDDCDERVDDDDDDLDPGSAPTSWFLDLDGDGFGDGALPMAAACERPAGGSSDPGDCDDGTADVYPGAPEQCDGLDNDCNGLDDDGAPDWYPDLDGDGYGDSSGPPVAEDSCTSPGPNTSFRRGDCNDSRSDIYPGALERCDGLDNDCDGAVDADDDQGLDFSTFYLDSDGDGAGDPDQPVVACDPPANYVAVGGDCDDADATRHPGAVEVCGGIDEDCDGWVDLDDPGGVADATTFYPDADVDTYGSLLGGVLGCAQPPGHVVDGGDCNDGDPDVYPGAREVCSGLDEDCDGLVDEEDADLDRTTATQFYVDGDGDGFGDVAGARACAAPTGQVAAGGDCDDRPAPAPGPDIFPGAPELCDGLDNDCDGVPDQVLPSWWPDGDGDGWGDDASPPVTQCDRPASTAGRAGDCDDGALAVYPGAAETCDGLDNDCDSLVDGDDADVQASTWYVDADGDGFGNPSTGQPLCPEDVVDEVEDGADCNDGSVSTHPGADELCNGRDDDCDGLADDADPDGPIGAPSWFTDADGDGYGVASQRLEACLAPAGLVAAPGDCDDANYKIRPGAAELCDGIDNDCDGLFDAADADLIGTCADATGDTGTSGCAFWFVDSDDDGYGDASQPTLVCGGPPPFHSLLSTDCDDSRADVNPGAIEACDPGHAVDEDCDGAVDDADPGPVALRTSYWPDGDGDGFGDSLQPAVAQCVSPGANYSALGGDCDDTTAVVSPAAPEVCDASNVDEDCDGAADDLDLVSPPIGPFLDWCLDSDGDGFGDPGVVVRRCDAPVGGFLLDCSDCDDGDPGVGAVCGSTGDTGTCGPAPVVGVWVDPPAGTEGVTQFLATASVVGGTPPVDLSFDWEGTEGPAGAALTDTHTYAGWGSYSVVVRATDACGQQAVASAPIEVAPAGALLEVTTSADESDAETAFPWQGTGLSLREAIVLANGTVGVQVVTFEDGLGLVQTGSGFPAITQDLHLVGRPGVVVDGSGGGGGNLISVASSGVRIVGLELLDFTGSGDGAIEIQSSAAGTWLEGVVISGSALGMRVNGSGTWIVDSAFIGNGIATGAQLELYAPTTLLGSVVASGPGGGVRVRAVASGTALRTMEIRGHQTWGVTLQSNAGGADDVAITDSTVVDNTGDGVVAEGGGVDRLDLRNTILAFNGGFGLDADDSHFSGGGVLDYDLFFANGSGDCSGCSTLGASSLVVDPRFVDRLGGDLSLGDGSPAIDAGDDTTGVDRNGALVGSYNGLGPDLGAVEAP